MRSSWWPMSIVRRFLAALANYGRWRLATCFGGCPFDQRVDGVPRCFSGEPCGLPGAVTDRSPAPEQTGLLVCLTGR